MYKILAKIESKAEMLEWAADISNKIALPDPWGELNYLIVRK